METNTAPAAQFKGYAAKLTNHEGKTSPCFVVNARDEMKFKDGTCGASCKVSVGQISGWQGWSGGCRPVYSYGPAIWVKASRVSR